jgi:hypothetical protein
MAMGSRSWHAVAFTISTKRPFYQPLNQLIRRCLFKRTFAQGFKALSLVPFKLDAVLSKLDVQLRTPTPPAPDAVVWQAQTLRNTRKIEAQSMLIRNCMQSYQESPASSLDEHVKQLSKGAQQIAHNMVLVQKEIGRL